LKRQIPEGKGYVRKCNFLERFGREESGRRNVHKIGVFGDTRKRFKEEKNGAHFTVKS